MTRLMQKAIDVLSNLPADRQDELAEAILAQTEERVVLTAVEHAAIAAGDADIKAGRIAPDSTIERLLARLRAA